MAAFVSVSELEPYNEICKINVQIIRMWRSDLPSGGHTVEMVLCDGMGNKIHASISKDFAARFEARLKEGYWKIIENFIVVYTGGAYRTTFHPCKIEFGVDTRVRVCDFFPRPLIGFQPVAFREILNGKIHTDYLVDLIGQIVGISYLEIFNFNGRDTEKITLELRNENDDRLTVNMWGKYAILISQNIHNLNPHKVFICVMRFAKISVFKDRSVSTAYNVTDVSLNPDTEEVKAFLKFFDQHDRHIPLVKSKPVSLVPEISEKIRFFSPITVKSIREVLETGQVERCIVYCSIAAIDYDINWFYMTCNCCCQKVVSVPRDGMNYGRKSSQKFYCAKCENLAPDLMPRYNIQLVVLDNTSDTKFQLRDGVAEKLLGIPCNEMILPGNDNITDPAFVHSVLSQLVGETYFFKIGIENQNVLFNSQTYKILEIIPTSEMINDFGLYRKIRNATLNTNGHEMRSGTGGRHQCTHAETLSFSQMPTQFIYDGQIQEWKKRSGYQNDKCCSSIKKIKNGRSG